MAPPAALALARPRPPCISTCGLGRGADLALGARFLARRVACCRSSRRCDKTPVPSALPPRGGLLVVGRAERVTSPPCLASLSAAPQSGAVSWLLGRWRFAHCVGFAESEGTPPASSLTLVAAPRFGGLLGEDLGVEVRIGQPHEPHRRSRSALAQNTNAEEATRAPHSGGQCRRRGGHVPALCKTHNKPPCAPKTTHPTPGLPPSRTRSVRYRGAADERE